MEHVGDITRLHGSTLAPVDIITFGSPCQGLSMAGKRLGLADERSGLFQEAIRIIKEMREATHGRYPQIAVWENVPGALSSDGGRDFKTVLEAFTEAKIPMPPSGHWTTAGMVRGGGVDISWCVYDAQYFGTAQRRRRVFLIADFTGRCAGEILFVPKSLRGYFAAGGTPRQGASNYLTNCAGTADEQSLSKKSNCLNGWDTQQSRVFTENGPSPTLAGADGGGGRNPAGLVYAAFMGGQSAAFGGIGYSEQVTPTLRTTMPPCVCEPQFARTRTARGDSSPCADRDAVLCVATGQAGAEVLPNQCPTLNCDHEQPYVTYPTTSGTLCGSGAGLSRPAGMASELDFCIVQEAIPIHDGATRCSGGGTTRKNNGSGNGLGIGKPGDPAPTITAGNCHGVAAVDCRNLRETSEISGTLQSKVHGYSLNYQNPVRICYRVRRLTPVECERLQGYPDGWTEYDCDGTPISDTRRYQMLGNSIAVPCVAYIMQGICDALKER